MAELCMTVYTRCTQEASLERSPLSPWVFLLCIYLSVCMSVFVDMSIVTIVLQRASASIDPCVVMSLCLYVLFFPCTHASMYVLNTSFHVCVYVCGQCTSRYGVAMTSRLLKILGLFCKRAL